MGVWKWCVATKLQFQYIEKMMLWTMVFLGVYPIFRYHNHKGISLFNQIFRYFDSMDFRQNLYRDTSKLLSTSIASNSLSKSIDTSKSSSISIYRYLQKFINFYRDLQKSTKFYGHLQRFSRESTSMDISESWAKSVDISQNIGQNLWIPNSPPLSFPTVVVPP
jgi:hypothetical protein